MKKVIITLVVLLAPWVLSQATQLPFSSAVKASVVFKEESNPTSHYPHVLLVYLRLENIHDADVNWVCDSVNGIEAELFDAKGNKVPNPPSAASIISGPKTFFLPFHSKLDWLISGGGISLMGNLKDSVAVIVGGRGWLIPKDSLPSYSLKLRVKGLPWTKSESNLNLQESQVLIDIPSTKVSSQ